TLHRIRYHGVECAANIELQAALDTAMPRRLYEYGSRASIVHKLPIISIVLWLHTRGAPPRSPYELRAAELLIATWHFHNIEVRKLSASAMITSGPLGLLPFIPFMQGADEARIEQAMRRVKSQAPAAQIEPLAFIMAVFTAQVNHDADLARAIIRRVFMSFDIFKDSPLYQEIIQEAAREAAEKAREDATREATEKAREAAEKAAQEAAEKAREAATREAKIDATRIALEGRFGALSEDMGQALNTAGEPTLTAILAHISSDTLAQVRERLGLKPQG
ncbi:MAG TPA: hypothetical protein VFU69_07420, partial [Ktedonobacterales bacterium]|nr:hypothetical protein [Ktedonobacterales bacterium]